jgi:hypothetical protein
MTAPAKQFIIHPVCGGNRVTLNISKREGYEMKKWPVLSGFLLLLVVALVTGCATAPGSYDRVATTSFGLGALGTAMGYAISGDPMGAALGGLSGLSAGYLVGTAIENSRPYYIEEPPPPPPPASGYYTPPPPPAPYSQYEERQRCRTVRTIVRENGQIVADYEREVCDQPY